MNDVEIHGTARSLTDFEPDLYVRIRQRAGTLSPAKLAVAEFIMDRYVDAAWLSAAKLAAAIGVSESVVVRLATDLDYGGYPELQSALQQLVRDRLAGTVSIGIDPGDEANVASRAFHSDQQLLQQTFQANDRAKLEAVADVLLQAQRIGVLGMRMAYAAAVDLGFRLKLLLGNADILQIGADMLEDDLRGYGPADLVVMFDFRPYHRLLGAVAPVLRERGVPIVAISDSALAPVAQEAHETLLAATEGDYGVSRSLIGAMALSNSLIAMLHERAEARIDGSVRETMALRLQVATNQRKR